MAAPPVEGVGERERQFVWKDREATCMGEVNSKSLVTSAPHKSNSIKDREIDRSGFIRLRRGQTQREVYKRGGATVETIRDHWGRPQFGPNAGGSGQERTLA